MASIESTAGDKFHIDDSIESTDDVDVDHIDDGDVPIIIAMMVMTRKALFVFG